MNSSLLRHDQLEKAVRANIYHLLACFLAAPPEANALRQAGALTGDSSKLGQAVAAFASVARTTESGLVADQYHRLFIGVGGGELTPFASHYLAGSMNDAPLVKLRQDMRRIGIRQLTSVHEPEDHVATLLEIMAGLTEGKLGEGTHAVTTAFYRDYIGSWIPDFLGDLAAIENAGLYAALARLGLAFLATETLLHSA